MHLPTREKVLIHTNTHCVFIQGAEMGRGADVSEHIHTQKSLHPMFPAQNISMMTVIRKDSSAYGESSEKKVYGLGWDKNKIHNIQ